MPMSTHVSSSQLLRYLAVQIVAAADARRKQRFAQIWLSILHTECEDTSMLILADHNAE